MRIILALLLSLGLAQASAWARDPAVMIRATDLREDARLARERNLVLVLEFSSEYCGYCRKLEDLFLLPMQHNADYDDKILIRYIPVDGYETLIDFGGQPMKTSQFASRYDVSLTPTLVFVDADGAEMSEKLVGIWSEDFFGAYIDNRIEQARDRLR